MAPPTPPVTFGSFQAALAGLVAKFDRQHPTYTAPDYNEQTLRADFLDQFFAALGWDVGNTKGLIHTEREVDIEVRTHMSGRQTRADYVFRLNRTERFTCEAKKPAEILHDRHIFQAKRDAFARGVPLALLSDFEETKIFIVGARPHLDDPHTGEYKVLNFRQYNDAARELWDLLAYESVKGGSIDRLIDSLPKRPLRLKGRQGWLIKPDRTRALDADFLNFLDDVRQQLGSDLLKHNDRADLLEGHRLNEAAQRIIDRLVFLRICEDRGIDTGTLLQTLFDGWYRQQPDAAKPKLRKPGKQTHMRFGEALEEEPPAPGHGARGRTEGSLYRELTEHIRALDQRPPSYKPFFNGQLFKPHFSEELVVGDEWLSNFLLDLVDDDSGYNFADIKVEILGDAYERFLGKILRPQGRGATIDEKPEVRKAGGVYYTPRYITDYIVEQTVGRLLEGKTPKQVEKLKIVDPACGSGSFLLRAYERVMEHHLRWFTANPDKRRKEDCYLDAANNVRLTTTLKRRILENNIHGVDIDSQAVEVTQLSLYLKMLEGENRETLRAQVELFKKEPLLPPLDRNIKCFNSLIASDFSLDPAELVRVNAGDWDVHFADIMKSGGFDAVIGNPPYVFGEFVDPEAKNYFRENYRTGRGQMDLYHLFLERALRLTKRGRYHGFIVPDAILARDETADFRKAMLTHHSIIAISHPGAVFQGVGVSAAVLCSRAHQVSGETFPFHAVADGQEPTVIRQIDASRFTKDTLTRFTLDVDGHEHEILQKISAHTQTVGDSCVFSRGEELGKKNFGRVTRLAADSEWIRVGEDVHRYELVPPSHQIRRSAVAKDRTLYCKPKLVIVKTGSRPQATFDNTETVTMQSLYNVRSKSAKGDLRVMLAILNSGLVAWYLRKTVTAAKKLFPQFNQGHFEGLPVPAYNETLKAKLVALVDKMLTLTPALRTAKSDAEKTTLQNALTKTDREIDQLVYQLYGLTPEEIALVEGTGNPAPAGPAD